MNFKTIISIGHILYKHNGLGIISNSKFKCKKCNSSKGITRRFKRNILTKREYIKCQCITCKYTWKEEIKLNK